MNKHHIKQNKRCVRGKSKMHTYEQEQTVARVS